MPEQESIPPLWIQIPWLGDVLTGRKTVEGRVLGVDGVSKWKEGDTVWVGSGPDDVDMMSASVMAVRHYFTLAEYLLHEWRKAAPHCETLQEAAKAYSEIMTTSKGVEADGVAAGKDIAVFDPRRVVARRGIVALELALWL